MTRARWTVGVAAGVLLAAAGPAPGQAPVTDSRQLEARLARLEQSMSSSSLLQMHETLQGLSREVRELRGEIELQRHDMEQLKQRQRELYLDVDRRLQALEASVAAAPPADVAASPGPAPGAGQAATPAPIPTPTPVATPQPGADTPPPPAAPAAQAADPAAEQQAYRDAFELLKSGQFTQASAALTQFLADHPSGRFTDNAWYWLGESYYVSREFGPALKAFEQLLVDFPDSPKRSHAMLKIGFIHDEEGRKDQAKQVLTELVRTYPQSTAASLADKRLKRLQ